MMYVHNSTFMHVHNMYVLVMYNTLWEGVWDVYGITVHKP